MVSQTKFQPGALVKARNRDWVVIPSDEEGVVRLRPVDGTDEDAIGIYTPLERHVIEPSQYPPPDPTTAGDFTGGRLLLDAVRLTLRSGAGPFRSLGRLSFTPRPYQFVPLIMALRLDPVRLLIADDVGVGKTMEAGMIARELLDRGLARRMVVLSPPHLCEQWAREMHEKFSLETAIIQPSRIARLERDIPRGDINIYQYYRHLVVSIDYIKTERNRGPFLDNLGKNDIVIVDEAHTAARPRGDVKSVQQQRYAFLKELSAVPERHLILVTATPHSGIEESFRSLLGLLDPKLDRPIDLDMPLDPLLPYIVQRRRADLKNWLGKDTPFPERDPEERTYSLSSKYLKLFEDVLAYCRQSVADPGMKRQQQLVRYWAAIAIMRCLLSSPQAAQAMLTKQAAKHKGGDGAEPDDHLAEGFGPEILDSSDEDEPSDYIPSAPLDDPDAALEDTDLRKLNQFLKTARELAGPEHDHKLATTAGIVGELLQQGYHPIVYCRFIATAEYVAEHLQAMLAKKHPGLRAVAVTGGDGDSEQREEKVAALAREPVRVLVATECLSEGINLQEDFDAVVHYDLPWNPNRLEQREGRVDRYGQRSPKVKAILLYGANNPVDLAVLDVLIKKAHEIRKSLGVSVPVPVDSEQVIQAVVDNVLLLRPQKAQQLQLDLTAPTVSTFHTEWDRAAKREARNRAYFAQHGIKPDEVARELNEMNPVLGEAADVQRFVANAIQRFSGSLTDKKDSFSLNPGDLAELMKMRDPSIGSPLRVAFDGVPPKGIALLRRDHPVVATLCDSVLGRALEGGDTLFSRCGAIYTRDVPVRTAVLILRLRYLVREAGEQFAEEVLAAACRRDGNGIQWLEPLRQEGLRLLETASVSAQMDPEERRRQIEWALSLLKDGWFESIVRQRTQALQDSHARLRKMIKSKPLEISPHEPPDILGCYVLVPAGGE